MPILIQLFVLTTVACIFFSRPVNSFFSDRLLNGILVLMVYAGISRLTVGLEPEVPYFFHGSVILAFALFTPGIYLYLRNAYYGTVLKKSDLLHVIPFVALFLYGLTSYVSGVPVEQELRKTMSFSSSPSYDIKVLMPLYLFIYCLTAFYFFLVLLLLKKLALLGREALLKFQSTTQEPAEEDHSQKPGTAHQPMLISVERMMEINCIVREVLYEKKPYLQPRYSLKDLTADTNIPLHHLSAFVNKYCGKNFNDFINEFRVLYCKEKILNQEYKYKKLEAIAEESGFNNRNTFAVAFKKVTGLNPSEFLKNVKSLNFVNEEAFERAGTIRTK